MTCHGESCRQGRAVCTEGCNKTLPKPEPEVRNEPYDTAADIAFRLPVLIFCTVFGCIAFSVSAWMLLGDSGIAYALASLVRKLAGG